MRYFHYLESQKVENGNRYTRIDMVDGAILNTNNIKQRFQVEKEMVQV
jgi:hypothetical protein